MVARAYNAGNPAGHEGRKKERGAGPRYPVGSPHPSSSAASFGESRAWTVGGEKGKAEAEEAGNGKVMKLRGYTLCDNFGNYGAYGWGLGFWKNTDPVADGSREATIVVQVGPWKAMWRKVSRP